MPREQRSIQLDPCPDPPVGNQFVDQLAPLVRSIYTGCYREFTGKNNYVADHPAWDGGEDSFGRRCRPIWPKIAETIVRLGVDPVAFIRAQFWCRRNDSRPPPPTYLLSDEAAARYGAYLQQAPAAARREYDAALATIQCEVLLLTANLGESYRNAIHYTLRNVTTVRASALIRYCLSVIENLPDLMQLFHDQALLQYVFQQEIIDAAFGERIPAVLREECVQLRAQILGRT